MLDQFAQPGGDIRPLFLRSGIADALRTLVEKHPGLVSGDEAARLKKAADAAKDDKQTYFDAIRRLSAHLEPPKTAIFFTAGLLTSVAVSIIPLLLLAGAIAWVVAQFLRKAGEPDAARLGVLAISSLGLPATR